MNRGYIPLRTPAQIIASRINGKKAAALTTKPMISFECEECGTSTLAKPGMAAVRKYCCIPCAVRARSKSPSVREKISAYARSRKGGLHPRWIADREEVKKRKAKSQAIYRLIYHSIRGTNRSKSGRVEAILGYSRESLYAHLECQFSDGMSWDNYGLGGWTIDHRRPIADFPIDATLREINDLENLRPLWAVENSRLGAHFSHARNRCIAAYGDAILPQIATATGIAMRETYP